MSTHRKFRIWYSSDLGLSLENHVPILNQCGARVAKTLRQHGFEEFELLRDICQGNLKPDLMLPRGEALVECEQAVREILDCCGIKAAEGQVIVEEYPHP